jgi:hypothetical protein
MIRQREPLGSPAGEAKLECPRWAALSGTVDDIGVFAEGKRDFVSADRRESVERRSDRMGAAEPRGRSDPLARDASPLGRASRLDVWRTGAASGCAVELRSAYVGGRVGPSAAASSGHSDYCCAEFTQHEDVRGSASRITYARRRGC